MDTASSPETEIATAAVTLIVNDPTTAAATFDTTTPLLVVPSAPHWCQSHGCVLSVVSFTDTTDAIVSCRWLCPPVVEENIFNMNTITYGLVHDNLDLHGDMQSESFDLVGMWSKFLFRSAPRLLHLDPDIYELPSTYVGRAIWIHTGYLGTIIN